MKWIKLSERMPDPKQYEKVLFFIHKDDGNLYLSRRIDTVENYLIYKDNPKNLLHYATQWMPLTDSKEKQIRMRNKAQSFYE